MIKRRDFASHKSADTQGVPIETQRVCGRNGTLKRWHNCQNE